MNTPLPSSQRNYSILAATFAGFVALALLISCAVLHPRVMPLAEQPAKYILTFGEDPPDPNQRVMVNIDAFERALGWGPLNLAQPPNWTTLKKRLVIGQPEEDVRTKSPQGAPPSTVTIAHLTIKQTTSGAQPCTLHVTQKVGLNNLTQVKAVLAAVQQPP